MDITFFWLRQLRNPPRCVRGNSISSFICFIWTNGHSTYCAVTRCVRDNKVARQSVESPSEESRRILYCGRKILLACFRVRRWRRRHFSWINYKYGTGTVWKQRRIALEFPRQVSIDKQMSIFSTTTPGALWDCRRSTATARCVRGLCGLILRMWLSILGSTREGNVSESMTGMINLPLNVGQLECTSK